MADRATAGTFILSPTSLDLEEAKAEREITAMLYPATSQWRPASVSKINMTVGGLKT